MTMKRLAYIIIAAVAMTGCGNNSNKAANTNETLESWQSGYADIVSFIVKGYQCGWEGMDFFEKGNLSMAYLSCSTDCGYAELDINGDGVRITIFKPLPGQGEPRVTSIEIESPGHEVASYID